MRPANRSTPGGSTNSLQALSPTRELDATAQARPRTPDRLRGGSDASGGAGRDAAGGGSGTL